MQKASRCFSLHPLGVHRTPPNSPASTCFQSIFTRRPSRLVFIYNSHSSPDTDIIHEFTPTKNVTIKEKPQTTIEPLFTNNNWIWKWHVYLVLSFDHFVGVELTLSKKSSFSLDNVCESTSGQFKFAASAELWTAWCVGLRSRCRARGSRSVARDSLEHWTPRLALGGTLAGCWNLPSWQQRGRAAMQRNDTLSLLLRIGWRVCQWLAVAVRAARVPGTLRRRLNRNDEESKNRRVRGQKRGLTWCVHKANWGGRPLDLVKVEGSEREVRPLERDGASRRPRHWSVRVVAPARLRTTPWAQGRTRGQDAHPRDCLPISPPTRLIAFVDSRGRKTPRSQSKVLRRTEVGFQIISSPGLG